MKMAKFLYKNVGNSRTILETTIKSIFGILFQYETELLNRKNIRIHTNHYYVYVISTTAKNKKPFKNP